MRNTFKNGAVGTGGRLVRLYAGPDGAAVVGGQFAFWNGSVNSLSANGELISRIDVQSDGSANHVANPSSSSNAVSAMAPGYQAQSAQMQSPLVDFSAPWEIAVVMQSAAETAVTITGATWSGGVATYTTSAAHTLAVGDKDVISGITPSGYNGTLIVSAVGSSTTFSVPMAADPGAYTSGGQSSRISNMISQSYVLELVG